MISIQANYLASATETSKAICNFKSLESMVLPDAMVNMFNNGRISSCRDFVDLIKNVT